MFIHGATKKEYVESGEEKFQVEWGQEHPRDSGLGSWHLSQKKLMQRDLSRRNQIEQMRHEGNVITFLRHNYEQAADDESSTWRES